MQTGTGGGATPFTSGTTVRKEGGRAHAGISCRDRHLWGWLTVTLGAYPGPETFIPANILGSSHAADAQSILPDWLRLPL